MVDLTNLYTPPMGKQIQVAMLDDDETRVPGGPYAKARINSLRFRADCGATFVERDSRTVKGSWQTNRLEQKRFDVEPQFRSYPRLMRLSPKTRLGAIFKPTALRSLVNLVGGTILIRCCKVSAIRTAHVLGEILFACPKWTWL